MVIMLFIFIIIIFPIRLNSKIYVKPEEEIIYIKFFIYKFFVSDVKIFILDNEINYKIGKKAPSIFKFTFPFESNNNQINYVKINKIEIVVYLGVNTFVSTFGSLILDFASKILKKSSEIDTKLKVIPIYFSNSLHVKGRVIVLTNVLRIISALFVNLISRILKPKKENKNAI